jgi:hypothetical protein
MAKYIYVKNNIEISTESIILNEKDMAEKLNSKEREKLNELVKEFGSEDNTENIREEKNSGKIRDDVNRINTLRNTRKDLMETNFQEFIELSQVEASFLFMNYTNIFNKVVKGEVDLTILSKFLVVLKLVEDGKVDQHEGSVIIGKILKELYLDSAVKAADNLDKIHEQNKVKPSVGIKISWAEYKKNNLQ